MTKKLFIGIPCHGLWVPQFGMSLYRSGPVFGAAVVCSVNGFSRPTIARDYLAREFLDSDCSHLLFLDTDLEWSADSMARFLERDLDVVGGTYFQKRLDQNIPVINAVGWREFDASDGLVECVHVGTGLMLIKREVFEALAPSVNEYLRGRDKDDPRPVKRFFAEGIHDGYDEPEDWWFCRQARDAGFKVWADTAFQARHYGMEPHPHPAVEALKQQVREVIP